MQLKTILNLVCPLKRFVYGRVRLERGGAKPTLVVAVAARKRARGCCGVCGKRGPTYDHETCRRFVFVPLWGIPVTLEYAPRRVSCKRDGVRVEMLPWADRSSQTTFAMLWFLSSFAKVLSWKETSRRFGVSEQLVFRAVEAAVTWGRAHMSLEGIHSIGVDEIAWRTGHKYLTVVYQIDHHCKRLLYVAENRTKAAFHGFFDWLGPERAASIQFVASDMWKAFLSVVRLRAAQAVHVLDRFHLMQMLSKAIDDTRRAEVRDLRARGRAPYLSKSRYILLKHQHRLGDDQRSRLAELLRVNLRTVKAYLLKERLLQFWNYKTPYWAGRFLDAWTCDALRSRIEPIKAVARSFREHRSLILNWFRAKRAFAAGATEGLNNKAKLSSKIAYGFRSRRHAEIALYHRLGNLPEPDWLAHKFAG